MYHLIPRLPRWFVVACEKRKSLEDKVTCKSHAVCHSTYTPYTFHTCRCCAISLHRCRLLHVTLSPRLCFSYATTTKLGRLGDEVTCSLSSTHVAFYYTIHGVVCTYMYMDCTWEVECTPLWCEAAQLTCTCTCN